jgi:hypothetical protein
MDDILKALMGGASEQAGAPEMGGDALSDLLGGIMGGESGPQSQQDQPSNDMLGQLLGGLMGGESGSQSQQGQPSNDMLGELLGGLMGGGGQQGSGGIGDLLSAVLGGSGGVPGGQGAGSLLGSTLAENAGLSPTIAQTIISFFTARLLSSRLGGLTAGDVSDSTFQAGTSDQNTPDLDHLLEIMNDEQALNSHLKATGMSEELARHAGIDQDTASRGMQELLNLLAGQS